MVDIQEIILQEVRDARQDTKEIRNTLQAHIREENDKFDEIAREQGRLHTSIALTQQTLEIEIKRKQRIQNWFVGVLASAAAAISTYFTNLFGK